MQEREPGLNLDGVRERADRNIFAKVVNVTPVVLSLKKVCRSLVMKVGKSTFETNTPNNLLCLDHSTLSGTVED